MRRWVGMLVLAACGDGIAQRTPANLLEAMAAQGGWVDDQRYTVDPSDCDGCETLVSTWSFEWDAGCDCAIATVTNFGDTFTAGSLHQPGDEICRSTYEVHLQPAAELDPMLRTLTDFRLTSSTCGETPWNYTVRAVLDAPAEGTSSLVTMFFTSSRSPTVAWPGWREPGSDGQWVFAFVPCGPQDYVPGRSYCDPTCDISPARPGRPECPTHVFEPPPPYPPCNTVVQSGQQVDQVAVAATLPTPAGGIVADGTYHLTAWNLYTGVGGQSGATGERQALTASVTGETVQMASRASNGTTFVTFSFLRSGADTIITQTCPDFGRPGFDKLTATADMVILYDTVGQNELQFTRVP